MVVICTKSFAAVALVNMRALAAILFIAIGFTAADEYELGVGIIGGSVTTVESYPYVASLLFSSDLVTYWQNCVGAILTSKTILSTARCFDPDDYSTDPQQIKHSWRIRVGTNFANSGGVVHITDRVVFNPDYDPVFHYSDIALLHTATVIAFNDRVRVGSISGPNYALNDNQELWAVGWGKSSMNAANSEQMRHIRLKYLNRDSCLQIYRPMNMFVVRDMMCSSLFDSSARNECQGSQGNPILHNNVIVGLTSWGLQCELSNYPGIGTRISAYTRWIQDNAV